MEYLCFLVLLVYNCVQLSTCIGGATTIPVNWTRQSVAVYTPSNPLRVQLGDRLEIHCPQGSFSNVWKSTNEQQYQKCNCSCPAEGVYECEEDFYRYGLCTGSPSSFALHITTNSDFVQSGRSFDPGTFYYFMSYSNGLLINDAFSVIAEGGECLPTPSGEPGLRMALFVEALTTEPPTTEEETTDSLIADTSSGSVNVGVTDQPGAGSDIIVTEPDIFTLNVGNLSNSSGTTMLNFNYYVWIFVLFVVVL